MRADVLFYLIAVVASWFLMQRYVRRAREAGKGKLLAYFSIVPVVNMVTTIVLLLLPPSAARPEGGDSN